MMITCKSCDVKIHLMITHLFTQPASSWKLKDVKLFCSSDLLTMAKWVHGMRLLQVGPTIYCNSLRQWNPSNPDSIEPEENILMREVSLFQGLKVHKCGTWKFPVCFLSSFQGILIEGFHCITCPAVDIYVFTSNSSMETN